MAVPPETPVTRPVLLTVATEGLALLQTPPVTDSASPVDAP
jgi:hypothetical protein